MIVFQVRSRGGKPRFRRLTVTGETATSFRRPGPVALYPSKRNTFRSRRKAIAYLAGLLG